LGGGESGEREGVRVGERERGGMGQREVGEGCKKSLVDTMIFFIKKVKMMNILFFCEISI
jgi:hypothetical protein